MIKLKNKPEQPAHQWLQERYPNGVLFESQEGHVFEYIPGKEHNWVKIMHVIGGEGDTSGLRCRLKNPLPRGSDRSGHVVAIIPGGNPPQTIRGGGWKGCGFKQLV